MQPERPVNLTFPANDIGWVRIMAGGVQVCYIRRDGRWRAFLWNEAGNRHGGYADAPVTGETLGDLRAELRGRVALKGPWWTGEP